MISGINHLTLSVRELDRSLKFYDEILGMRLLARWKRGVYLLAGETWVCLTLDARVRVKPLPEYTHVAFTVAADKFPEMAQRVSACASIWKENTSEGASLYFLDPDGHKLELHVSDWRARIAACRAAPYDDMVFYDHA